MKLPLNYSSIKSIYNISDYLKSHPLYSDYEISAYCYDEDVNVYAIEVKRNGENINLFLFYPDAKSTGQIGSIAIYGICLEGHLNAILSSHNIFGFTITSAHIDKSGISDFVDVTLL